MSSSGRTGNGPPFLFQPRSAMLAHCSWSLREIIAQRRMTTRTPPPGTGCGDQRLGNYLHVVLFMTIIAVLHRTAYGEVLLVCSVSTFSRA